MTIVNSAQAVNWTNVSNFQQFIAAANQSAGNLLFLAIDLLVFFVMFISLTGTFGWEAAILSSGFIGIILSLLFSYMGVLAWKVTGVFVGVIVIIILYILWSNKYD